VQQIEAQYGPLMKKLGYALVSQPAAAVVAE
jgi:membrane protein YdbS with pleckstrin-like domain